MPLCQRGQLRPFRAARPTTRRTYPLPVTGRHFHDVIILTNKLPRLKASELLAEGAAGADLGAGCMDGSEDMDISDGAGTEP